MASLEQQKKSSLSSRFRRRQRTEEEQEENDRKWKRIQVRASPPTPGVHLAFCVGWQCETKHVSPQVDRLKNLCFSVFVDLFLQRGHAGCEAEN